MRERTRRLRTHGRYRTILETAGSPARRELWRDGRGLYQWATSWREAAYKQEMLKVSKSYDKLIDRRDSRGRPDGPRTSVGRVRAMLSLRKLEKSVIIDDAPGAIECVINFAGC